MDLLAAPIKRACELNLVRPLKTIISSSYSTADNPADFDEAIQELNKLRTSASQKCYDKVESSLDVLYRYYDQLVALERKIPPSEVLIYFKWKDAFDSGSWLSGRQSLTVSSFGFERACLLYNLAALQSQIAAAQNLQSDDGLKMAAKMMQLSASNFSQLKTFAPSTVGQEPTQDLKPETLTALCHLMLAQSQEAFVLKAIRDQMKDAIIAKLCVQCEEYYGEALRAMQRDNVKSMWEKDWLATVSAKQSLYQAHAEYHQSRICNVNKAVGEEIARLQLSEHMMKTTMSRVSDASCWTSMVARVSLALTAAKKDNDFIYHERIPDVKSLPAIGKAPVAKILSPPEQYSKDFKDLFAKLTPVHVQQAMAGYDVRKSALVNAEVGKLRDATQTLNGILASLNLPAALEDTCGTALPTSIGEKAAQVRGAGGLQALHGFVSELPELLSRNKDILDETERLLTEERQSDEQLRAQFQAKWTRTPSDKLTESFRQNAAKYRQIIANAMQADGVVREKFDKNRNHIELLSRPESELKSAVPNASGSGGGGVDNSTPAVQRLHGIMDRVVHLKSERDQLDSQLKSATTDIKATFLRALQADESASDAAVSDDLLQKTYGPLVARAAESLARQEKMVAEIQEANDAFVLAHGSSGSSRNVLFKELATAYDVFVELRGNLKEGMKFYNDLTQVLLNFQNKVSDFCFARKTEKEELMKDLTLTLANQNSSTTPALPAHVQAAANQPSGRKEPPPRPPPPSTGTPPTAPNPYAGAPPGAMPYPVQPQAAMPQPYAPYPYFTPMPAGYNPYGTFPGAMPPHHMAQPPAGYPAAYGGYPAPQSGPQQQQQQPGYPYPQQQYR